jgi:hypothetical protein
LKVWQADSNGIFAYNGNDQNVEFSVIIYSTATPSNDNQLARGDTETINFNGGIGSGLITNIKPIVSAV